MTIEDAYKVIVTLKAVYNAAFSKYSTQDFDNLAAAWAACLEDYDYKTVSMGVKAYMTTNPSQFPPVPAQIIQEVQNLHPQQQLNANEAWALVYKAVCNSTYNAQREFERLPETVQKAVGSADTLRAWAMDDDFNFGVEQSHFVKAYNIVQEREQKTERLPQSIRTAVGMIGNTERLGITG